MRFLDAGALIYDNIAELVNFPDERSLPEYAILSRTWSEEEVLFEDIPLGPQHEVKPSAVALRAANRRRRWCKEVSSSGASSEESSGFESDSDLSSENSSNVESEHVDSSGTGSSSDFIPDSFSREDTTLSWMLKLAESYIKVGWATTKPRSGPVRANVKAGWNKILNTCLRALQDGYSYVWIDTCCIDKSSSAQLSEAIDSMWRYYKDSHVCYVFLSDCLICPGLMKADGWFATQRNKIRGRSVPPHFASKDGQVLNGCMRARLRQCRWFTRGWTLQELLAPFKFHFFDSRWYYLAERSGIVPTLTSITGIHERALENKGRRLCFRASDFSIAQRMYWAANRITTRTEDEAYSLLGIFDIKMPLLYGERKRAFVRLQETNHQNFNRSINIRVGASSSCTRTSRTFRRHVLRNAILQISL